jgi:hypothetical protein
MISAIVHGMSHLIGSVAVGQMADLAFWDFDSFGARPNMIVKGGVIAWAQVSPIPLCSATLKANVADGRCKWIHPDCSASDWASNVGVPPFSSCFELGSLGQPSFS